MNLKLEIEFSKADVFKQVDALKKQIDDQRPLPPDVEGRVMQKLRLDWNYNSNAIEGNKLSYGETTALLMHGITAKGKPLKDHLDIQGHDKAIDFLLTMVQDGRPITEADIRGLHEIILGEPRNAPAQTADGTPTTKLITVGEYKTSANHVQTATGAIHYYATPEETPAKMQELMEWYNKVSANTEIHPIVTAALFHHRFVAIHPFDDGNGRMSRILMNLILMRSGYPVAVIKNDDKGEYYSLLSRADVGDTWPFVEYIIERVEASVKLYIKAIEGGDINESEDLDKEIALFALELKFAADEFNNQRTNIKKFVIGDLKTMSQAIFNQLSPFKKLFNQDIKIIKVEFIDGTSKNVNLHDREFVDENNDFSDIKSIHINYGLLQLRDVKYIINSSYAINVIFGNDTYKIFQGEVLLLQKHFKDRLIENELNTILKAATEHVKIQIRDILKSLKA